MINRTIAEIKIQKDPKTVENKSKPSNRRQCVDWIENRETG